MKYTRCPRCSAFVGEAETLRAEAKTLRDWIGSAWAVFGWYQEWLERLKHENRELKAQRSTTEASGSR